MKMLANDLEIGDSNGPPQECAGSNSSHLDITLAFDGGHKTVAKCRSNLLQFAVGHRYLGAIRGQTGF